MSRKQEEEFRVNEQFCPELSIHFVDVPKQGLILEKLFHISN